MSRLEGRPQDVRGRVGVVTARFNSLVTERLEQGALDELARCGISADNVVRVSVPGAVEIPLAAKALLEQGVIAVVALGVVIRGETSHYDSVCRMAENGCLEVQLTYGRPVAFGVLTTENRVQALARAGGSRGNKGADAAAVALEMVDLLRQIASGTEA